MILGRSAQPDVPQRSRVVCELGVQGRLGSRSPRPWNEHFQLAFSSDFDRSSACSQ